MARRLVRPVPKPEAPPPPAREKLSPGQQHVVNALWKGWKLYHAQTGRVRGARTTSFSFGVVLARDQDAVDLDIYELVNERVLRALRQKQVLEAVPHQRGDPHPLDCAMRGIDYRPREAYRLTDGWRTP